MDSSGGILNQQKIISKEEEEKPIEEISQEEKEKEAIPPKEDTQDNTQEREKETETKEKMEEIGQSSSSDKNINVEKNNTNGLKITIMTSGSRGDVQPYAVLAQALQRRGHKVVLAVEERMHSFVDSFGVPYAHVAGDPTSVLFSKEGQQMLNDGQMMVLMKEMKKIQAPTFDECLGDYTKACEGADVIISGPLVMTQSYCIAEKNKSVWIPLILGPSYPTEQFPLYMISHTSFFFKFFNKVTYNFMFYMLWQSESSQINKWRTTVLGLKPLSSGILSVIEKHKNCTVINAYSEYLIPGENRCIDWPPQIKLSGFIFPPQGMIQLTTQLEEFINNGPAPIYLGFGSMPAPNPQKLIDIAVAVATQLDARVVLMAGWTELTPEMRAAHKSICVVDSAPHEWLLPRCSVLVHHGGVGTTAAALRAGVPSVVCPVYLDQPYWGFRLKSLGVATDPIPFQKLSAKLLVESIRNVSDYMRERAKEIAKEIAKVDGVQQAIDLIEQAAQVPLFTN